MLVQLFEYLVLQGHNALVEGIAHAGERRLARSVRPVPVDRSASGRPLAIGMTISSARDRSREPRPVPLPMESRYRHLFITGATGSGKSTLARALTIWDIENGNGLVNIDYRGESTDQLLRELAARHTPDELRERLVVFDMRSKSAFGADSEPVVGFNPLTALGDDPYVAVANFIDVLRQIWGEATLGVRLIDQLRHVLLALCQSPSGPYTLVDVEPMLLDAAFRGRVLAGIHDPVVTRYFQRFDSGKDRESEAEAVLNKLTPLLATHRRLRATLGAGRGRGRKAFSFRDLFFRTKAPYVLVCVDAGGAGKQVAGIIAALFLTAIVRAAMPSDAEPGQGAKGRGARAPLHLVLDEFVNYAAACREPLDDLVREGRKFRTLATLITQSPGLLDAYTRNLLVNVVGNLAYFAQGPEDANTVAGLIAVEEIPKPVLRTLLQQAKPGEAMLLQQGVPLKRIRVSLPPSANVDDGAVRAVRAAALAHWGGRTDGEGTDEGRPREEGDKPVPPTPVPAASDPAASQPPQEAESAPSIQVRDAQVQPEIEVRDTVEVREVEPVPARPRKRSKAS